MTACVFRDNDKKTHENEWNIGPSFVGPIVHAKKPSKDHMNQAPLCSRPRLFADAVNAVESKGQDHYVVLFEELLRARRAVEYEQISNSIN